MTYTVCLFTFDDTQTADGWRELSEVGRLVDASTPGTMGAGIYLGEADGWMHICGLFDPHTNGLNSTISIPLAAITRRWFLPFDGPNIDTVTTSHDPPAERLWMQETT